MTTILYCDNEKTISDKVFLELKISDSIEKICRNTEKAKRFVKILSSPLTDKEAIIKRQNVLKDIIEHQEGFFKLVSLAERLNNFHNQYEENKKKMFIMGTQSSIDNSMAVNSNILNTTSFLLKRCVLLLKDIYKTIDSEGFLSDGILALKERITEIVSDKTINEIISCITLFNNFR